MLAQVMLRGLFTLNAHPYWIGSQVPLTTDDKPFQMNSTSFMSFQARMRMMSDAAWFGS